MNRSFLPTSMAVCVLSIQGCATILNDSTQPVAFSSDPQGAIVAVNGVAMGRTPCTLPIQRKGWDKQVSFTLDGHKPVSFTLKNSLDGAVAGNFILGGIIGGVIDGISGRGGGYQESVQVVLVPVESSDDSRLLPTDTAAKAAESADSTGRIQSGEATAVPPGPSPT
jgi:hypothetical protein